MAQADSVSLPSRRIGAWVVGLALAGALAYLSLTISPMTVIIITFVGAIGITLLRWPWVGVAALVASVPVQQVGAISGGALTATRASLLLAIVGYLIAVLVQRRRIALPAVAVPFAAFVAWMAVSLVNAADVRASVAETARWTIAFLAFVVAVQFIVRANMLTLTVFVLVMALAGALEATLGSALGLLGFGPESFQIAGDFTRAFGTFGRPNTFAGYLELTMFPPLWFTFYQLYSVRDRLHSYRVLRLRGSASTTTDRNRLLLAVVVVVILAGSSLLMLVGVGFSFSRGAWLGVVAGLGATALVATRRYWLVVASAIPVVLLLALLVGFQATPEALAGRVGSIVEQLRPVDAATVDITDENFAVAERMAHWQAGWRMFEDEPLTGVGAGNYNVRYPDYFVRTDFRYSQGHAHNFYIHVLAETGLIGLVLYLTMVLSFLFLSLWIAWTADEPIARFLALGALGTTTALLVHNLFENLHVLNIGVQLSATWALAVAAHHRARLATSSESPTLWNTPAHET